MTDIDTTDVESIDFFTDQSLVPNPYPYFDALRSQCPVMRATPFGVVAVTGHEEAAEVYKDGETYSSAIAVGGPFPPLPFTPEGDDISEQIEAHRDQLLMSEHMITMDSEKHQYARSLLNRLITPRRLKENEEFMWRLADQVLDDFIDDGKTEFLSGYAKPFAMLVIADMLGVPEEDHERFRHVLGAPRPGARVGALDGDQLEHNPLQWLDDTFSDYLNDRRANPREDVLTGLATAVYPDGSTPEVSDVVKSATFLFAAGQETTTKLLSAGLHLLAERPEIFAALRDDRSKIPSFVEEVLRTESPVKSDFRLVRHTTTLGGQELKAGTTVMIIPGGVNRDPRKFEDPNEFKLDRPNAREHLAFARGAHSCPGAPLARVEGRVSFERILDRLANITIDEDKHGPAGNRNFEYEPTFIMRGLTQLNVKFDKIQ